ncbi:TOBE domain-containing protein [Natronorubrum tibetense]|uniref:TOBE domain-containing protein n=1 Tax=Natronorubrum tibetense TaxID=63128 RepID=UPI001375B6FF
MVRSENFSVRQGQIHGELLDIFYLGDQVQLFVELPNEERVTVRMERTADSVKQGDSIPLNIDPDGIHVIC